MMNRVGNIDANIYLVHIFFYIFLNNCFFKLIYFTGISESEANILPLKKFKFLGNQYIFLIRK